MASGARVTLLSVMEQLPADLPHTGAQREAWSQRGKRYLTELLNRLKPHGFPIDMSVRTGLPSNEICSFIQESDVDLVVIATHGASQELEHPMGSTTWKVLQRCSCPVMLVRTNVE